MIAALEDREKLMVRLATWEGRRPGKILALLLRGALPASLAAAEHYSRPFSESPANRRQTISILLPRQLN